MDMPSALRCAAMLAVCTALLACDGGPSTTTAAAPRAASGAPAAAASVDPPARRIAAANAAFADGRFVAPAGDNALEWLVAARAAQPDHPGVVEALVDLHPIALAAAERALTAGDAGEARRIIDLLDRVQPGSLGTQRLRERIDAASEVADTALARQVAPGPSSTSAPAGVAGLAAPPVAPPAAAAPAVASPPATPALAASPGEAPSGPAPAIAARGEPSGPRVEGGTPPAAAAPPPEPPRVVLRVEPAYPQLARQRRIEGWVELEFLVTADGRPSEIRVVESSPNAIFDVAATRALQRWRFEPARRGDAAPAARSRTRISFRLG